MKIYDSLRYNLVPPLFLIFFTTSVQFLALWGIRKLDIWDVLSVGNLTSIILTIFFASWAFFFLLLTSKEVLGPPDPQGNKVSYKGYGMIYYIFTMFGLVGVEAAFPGFCTHVFNTTPDILASLNLLALGLCVFLYIDSPSSSLPRIYTFYTGGKTHPRLFGVDVKHFTNSRMGMMLWQIMVAANWYHGLSVGGYEKAAFANFALQTLYIFRFFMKESWYFHSLDMTLDGGGYYMCWGCLVWLPSLFPLSSRQLALSSSSSSLQFLPEISLFLGIICLVTLHIADSQKMHYKLFVRRPSNPFLTSGLWSFTRHPNYLFDFLVSLFTSLSAFQLNNHSSFLATYFLLILFIHRVFRDEEKCKKKYGSLYKNYCSRIPYRLVPFIF